VAEFIPNISLSPNPSPFYRVKGPNTGGFIRTAKGDLFLQDSDRNIYRLSQVALASYAFNDRDGIKRFPRPWEFGEKGEVLKQGDTVLIYFRQGDMNSPIVFGSIEPVNVHDFLQTDRKNLDRRSERWETLDRIIEKEDDGKGNLSFEVKALDPEADENTTIEDRILGSLKVALSKEGELDLDLSQIAGKTGTGNINLNLIGNDGQANGNLILNFNGKLKLQNIDDEGNVTQSIGIDNTEGNEKVEIRDTYSNKIITDKSGVTIIDTNQNQMVTDTDGVRISDKKDNEILIKTSESLVKISDKNGEKVEISPDGITAEDAKGNQIKTRSSGMELTDANGHKIITSKDGVVIEEEGGGKATLERGVITLQGQMIKLGEQAMEWLVKGKAWHTLFSSHNHLGNMGAPTGPPLNAAAASTALSTKSKTE